MEKRIVTLYTTVGKLVKIETDAATWGELKPYIENNPEDSSKNIDTSKLLATESINKTDLVVDEAVLPAGEFTIFFRPKDTKAGVMSYKEARSFIKAAIEKDPSAKEHFNSKGNYTNQSTAVLVELVQSYGKNLTQSKPAETSVEQEKKKNYDVAGEQGKVGESSITNTLLEAVENQKKAAEELQRRAFEAGYDEGFQKGRGESATQEAISKESYEKGYQDGLADGEKRGIAKAQEELDKKIAEKKKETLSATEEEKRELDRQMRSLGFKK